MKHYENIDEALCREMDMLDKKYANGDELSIQDLEKIRLLFSSMVKGETYYAMKEESEWDEDEMSHGGRDYSGRRGMIRSGRRGRDSMGRYVSRDMMPDMSGHYPEYMPPYYGGRY